MEQIRKKALGLPTSKKITPLKKVIKGAKPGKVKMKKTFKPGPISNGIGVGP